MARKSDIARYEILFNHGGIYLDCDIMPFQYFDVDLAGPELIACNEADSNEFCSNSFIASPPKHDVLGWALHQLASQRLNLTSPPQETGPWFFRKALSHGPIRCLPTASFYPYIFFEPFSAILERDLLRTFGIHVWGGSWLDETQTHRRALRRLQRGDLEEVEKIYAGSNSAAAAEIREFCNSARSARIAALTAAKHAALRSPLNIANKRIFEFLKLGLFLVSQNPSCIIWQIGAAEGILVDRVRPLP